MVSYIYSHINANETQYELLEIFRSMDTDGDGTLTFVELTEGIKQRMDIKKVHEDDLQQLMQQLDENGDGVISYEEFVAQANVVFMFLSENRLRQAFELFDLNEDGSIANFELQQVLTGGLKTIPEEDWDALIEKFDVNNDAKATAGETSVIRNRIQEWGGVVIDSEKVTGDLDFIVIGNPPPKPTEPSATAGDIETQAYTQAKNEYDTYERITKEAKDARIPMLNWNRFKALTGQGN